MTFSQRASERPPLSSPAREPGRCLCGACPEAGVHARFCSCQEPPLRKTRGMASRSQPSRPFPSQSNNQKSFAPNLEPHAPQAPGWGAPCSLPGQEGRSHASSPAGLQVAPSACCVVHAWPLHQTRPQEETAAARWRLGGSSPLSPVPRPASGQKGTARTQLPGFIHGSPRRGFTDSVRISRSRQLATRFSGLSFQTSVSTSTF